ncbi:MAG: hypothetical protein NTX88_03355 [Candidatus Atribacteria bacterium]|nr:hypothetical protein [Candidatus Atribacteria bacterium]
MMEQEKMPHPGHDRHLCHLQYSGYMNQHFDDFKPLVKNPQYICRKCGRAAASETSLCQPEKL